MLKAGIKPVLLVLLSLASVCLGQARPSPRTGRNAPASAANPASRRPGPTSRENQVNSAAGQKLAPPLEFSEQAIGDVFLIISDLTGWNIVPSAEVSKMKVSFWTKAISAQELLDIVVDMAGFVYHQQGATVTVMTYEEYVVLYGVAKEIIPLKYANGESVSKVIKPFLTKLGKVEVHKETNTVVLYEVPANLESLVTIARKLDAPSADLITKVVNLKYADCQKLAQTLEKLLTKAPKEEKNRTHEADSDSSESDHPTSPDAAPFEAVGIHAVVHANQIALLGTRPDVEKVVALIDQMDVAGDNLLIEAIQLQYADAEMVEATLRDLFQDKDTQKNPTQQGNAITRSRGASDATERPPGPSGGTIAVSPYSSVEIHAIGRTNQLGVKGSRGDIDKIREFIEKLDLPVEPVTQTYHFTYVEVAQVYTGIQSIINAYIGTRGVARPAAGPGRISGSVSQETGVTLVEGTNSILLAAPPSAHRIMKSIRDSIDVPGMYETGTIKVYDIENANVDEIAQTLRDLLELDPEGDPKRVQPRFLDTQTTTQEKTDVAQMDEFFPSVEVKISVNKATNSIIVQATTRQHAQIAKLIERLDIRRKQVLIKASIVEVTSSDSVDAGVELDAADLAAGDSAFTSYGLSTLDLSTFTHTAFGGRGANIAILSPGNVQGVLRFLQATNHVRIHSAPQLLVSDNETGNINSIAEEPTRQTAIGDVSTVTSFGEYVTAGTQFSITPHISKTNYLHVEYEIELSSFGDQADAELPPARNTSTISSKATVPDGHTIVVGGIQTVQETESVDKVPLLGSVPLLGVAFRNKTHKKQFITTYLFITTEIMKHEGFDDLKGASDSAIEHVETKREDAKSFEFPELGKSDRFP